MVERKRQQSSVTARSEDIDDLRERIGINRDTLDENIFEQPDLYFRVSDQVELLVSRRDKKQYELELTESEKAIKIRKRLDNSEKKVTDTAVRAEVHADPQIVELNRELQRIKSELGRWKALKEAFDHRNSMLKVAGQLYAANYFTRSSVSSAHNEMRDTDADRVRSAAGRERCSRMRD